MKRGNEWSQITKTTRQCWEVGVQYEEGLNDKEVT